MSLTNDFLNTRINAVKAEIVALEDAILTVTQGGVTGYTMNTGQGVVTVTKLNLRAMHELMDLLLSRLAGYESRLTGSNIRHGRAAW